MKKKILFVSHDASRTGAPIILLHLLRWLKENNVFDFSIMLQSGGPLYESFLEIGPTFIMGEQNNILPVVVPAPSGIKGLFKRKKPEPAKPQPSPFPHQLSSQHFDLIYLNTALGLTIANDLKLLYQCPVICHIHENEYALSILFNKGFPEHHKQAVDHFIAVSKSTRECLVNKHGIVNEKVNVVYEAIPINEIKTPSIAKETLLQQLGLKNNLIIGGAGSTDWRKGVDLFMQLGYWLNNLRPGNSIKLIWLGSISPEFSLQYAYEAKRLKIANSVQFLGAKEDPQNYFQLFDIFALTSREDPFPLVALESAALSKPIVFFDQAGGISELIVNNIGGVKIPYGDIVQMANTILRLADDNNLRLQKGKEAMNLVEKHDIGIISEQIIDIINYSIDVNVNPFVIK